MKENKILIPVIIISFVFFISVLIISGTWRANNKMNQTITVTGSAKKEIISDLAILRVTIHTAGFTQQEAYRDLKDKVPILFSYLNKSGFSKEKIYSYSINSYANYEINAQGNATSKIIGFNYNQKFEIQSDDVNKIKNISLDVPSLIEKGINIYAEPPEFYYTKLANIKIDIQSEAAKDAMIRAKKIAEATDSDLGILRSARMGVLQITPKNSNIISDYGMNDITSIEKEITAVVNAVFEIK